MLTQREAILQIFVMSVFFNLNEDFMFTLHNFLCMLLSVTVQEFGSKLQDVETKGNPINIKAFLY